MKYLIVSLIFFSLTALAQNDEKSQELLNKMSKEIKSLSSFYMEFSFTMKNAATGEDTKESGKGYVKGDKFNASLGDNEIISNGIKIWTVVKEENVTYESAADDEDEESINPKRLMTIWESGFKNKYVSNNYIKFLKQLSNKH